MKADNCLYILEDHPALFAKVKEFILQNDESKVPGYLKKLLEKTQAERSEAQLMAIKTVNAIDYVSEFVSRNPGMHKKAVENLISGGYYTGKKGARRLSMEGEYLAELHYHHAKLATAMSAYRPRKFGFDKSEKAQRELIRALYGETTDVDAKAYAKMLTESLQEAVDRYNYHGGGITKLDSYRLPQYSDPVAVERAGFEEWSRAIREATSPEEQARIVRQEGGAATTPLTPKQLDKALEKTYESIISRGAARVKPRNYSSGFRPAVASRHQQHRFFHFKDADAWLKYHDKFGEGTPYSAIMGHIDRLSRETAAMKVLGPHPEMALKYVSDVAIKESGNRSIGEFAKKMYQDLMGELDGATNPVWARRLRDARNVMAATKLGSAGISALSDLYFLGSAARMNGIPIVKTYTRFFKTLLSNSEEHRVLAGQLGLGMEYALDKVNQFNRINVVTGNNWTAKMADFALRVNGLNHWTHTAEAAFKMEFMQALGRSVDTPFEGLSPKLRDALTLYGITAEDWKLLRNAPRQEFKGVKYFTPITTGDNELTAKVLGMLAEEMRFAVPSPNVRVRTWMHQGQASGTVTGELMRSLSQFKSFPTTIMVNQLGRRLRSGSIASRLGQVSSMIVMTTIIGSMAYNLKQIAKGRTPLSWDSDEFWINGFVQGGALGIIGDLFYIDPDRRGSLIEFFGGPLAGEVEDFTLDFIAKPISELWAMEDGIMKGIADRAVSKAEDYLPPPLGLPFVKLAVKRGVTDTLHQLTDDKWYAKQTRLRKRLAREHEQTQWWEP